MAEAMEEEVEEAGVTTCGVGLSARLDRRGGERTSARGFVRYGRLWSVAVVDVGPSGLCVESELPFRFGPGWLHVSVGVGAWKELLTSLVWSRLVATERGDFGEICPKFHSGLHVDASSLCAWRAALPRLQHGG